VILNALHDKPIPVYGDGENIRDWIHVYDHCAALDAVLHTGENGSVYAIGANAERRNIDIVRMILSQLGKPQSLVTFVKDRPGHDRRYATDAEKIRKQLGWSPIAAFDVGLKETVNWYRDHPSGGGPS